MNNLIRALWLGMGLVVFVISDRPATAGEPVIERVFGPEIKTGPYKHPACLEEFDNGDLFLVYHGGEGEYASGTAVYGSRRPAGSDRWETPYAVARDPLRSLGNGVIWQAPDKTVWLFYVVRFGPTWSSSRIACKLSKDRGLTWSDSSMVTLEEGMMVRNKPIVLSDGRYVLPVYKETGEDPEFVGPKSTSAFLIFDPRKKEWTEGGRIHSPRGNIQPAIAQLEDGKMIAYCRRGGGYGNEVGYIVRSESADGGRTWKEGVDSPFPNPNAAVDFLKLKNQHLLLIYNNSMNSRTPLTIAVSSDQDRSYPVRKDLVGGPNDYGYPIILQARDGRIHVMYTSDRRQVINHAVFDESWLFEKTPPAK